jgi:hypothetical protein
MAKTALRMTAERRGDLRRTEDLARRITEVEEVCRANRRELDLQFRRMADMQAEVDALKKRSGEG